MSVTGRAVKAYSFFDTLLWIACLNLAWIAFTCCGLVIFGIGPSLVAAHELIRRHVRGESVPVVRGFARSFARNFVRGNALGLPVVLVAAMLMLNWRFFADGLTIGSQAVAGGIFVISLIFAATVCYLFPMFARYELPLPLYFLTSSRFALRHLAGSALLLFVTAAAVFASGAVPGLIPFFSIGAWMYAVGWLCDRFFTQNDEAVAGDGVGRPQAVGRTSVHTATGGWHA